MSGPISDAQLWGRAARRLGRNRLTVGIWELFKGARGLFNALLA